MGTRADFYVGRDAAGEWIGSIAWDGYPDGIPPEILEAKTTEAFRGSVGRMAETRNDFTDPTEHGWPWPWDTSYLTDFVYAFDEGRVWMCSFDRPWIEAKADWADDEAYLESEKGSHDWPYRGNQRGGMTFGPRSGVVVLGKDAEKLP